MGRVYGDKADVGKFVHQVSVVPYCPDLSTTRLVHSGVLVLLYATILHDLCSDIQTPLSPPPHATLTQITPIVVTCRPGRKGTPRGHASVR